MGFDLIIFEEASQLDITALLKVLTQVMRGRSSEKEINVILSGDPQQLPPHIEQQLPDCVINIDHDSALRKAHEYARRSPSFFATICSDHSADRRRVHTLTVQHRMHPEIALLVNSLFYRDQHWRWTRKQGDDSPAVWWVDSRPFGDEAERQHEGTSWFHRGELEIVRRLHAKHGDEQFLAVTAYRAQQELLEAVLGGSGSCCTIDGCQGIEADTVVFSFVRMALFVVDSHRLNVAFSRARKRLYLVGDFAQLCREAADFERPHIRGLAELFSDSGRFAGRVIAPDPGSWILP
jgi:superfamily I DNA and/or RNA helicase